MAASKQTRIIILLVIDAAFFLLELTVGYAVHSLALVADSFHMLNDVLSLCVGYWAVKVANERSSSNMYTYGWQRAETLGALINGVFLVALCVTIFLEAVQRFFEPQEINNPKLVLIVGSLGLASNIVGLFLFHDHGHSHGGGGHSHGHGHSHGVEDAAERGEAHTDHSDDEREAVADQGGNIADVMPESRVGGWPTTASMAQGQPETPPRQVKSQSVDFAASGTPKTGAQFGSSPYRQSSGRKTKNGHSRARSISGYTTFEEDVDIPINPAQIRKSVIDAGRYDPDAVSETESEPEPDASDIEPTESTSLLSKSKTTPDHTHTAHQHNDGLKAHPSWHTTHNHAKPKSEKSKAGGHSHGDLNMRGVFLHVMGDALGNVGVIATALFIWLSDYSWRFYSDPAVSLVITVIILTSAIPLCKAASRILLQAVPPGLSVDDMKTDIEALPGIISAHHVHVWQLSDTKLIASLHVQVDFDFKGEGSRRYMELAREIRACLHEFGVHSSTIQPEFCLDPEHEHAATFPGKAGASGSGGEGSTTGSEDTKIGNGHAHAHGNGSGSEQGKANGSGKGKGSKAASVCEEPGACLLECSDECAPGKQCCVPGKGGSGSEHSDGEGHGHGHHH